MPVGKTEYTNKSSHTTSKQGTWVENWRPPEKKFEDDSEDDHPYDYHKELIPGNVQKEA